MDCFLLTYSVIPKTEMSSDVEKADKVRNDIAKITIWDKSSRNETTFTGMVDANGYNDASRIKSAIKSVESTFIPILKKHNASFFDVVIYCTMMIDGVNKPFEFDVEQ